MNLFAISLSGNKPILLLNRQHITRFEFRKELRRRLNGKMTPHVSYKIYLLYSTYYAPGIPPCKLRVFLLSEVTEIRIPPLLVEILAANRGDRECPRAHNTKVGRT
jgi:hypothetical protein